MPPAARITDMHVCPMFTGPVPHVGGPIILGCFPVLTGMMPQARITDMALCAGPPDMIALGSFTVLVGGLPAARMGDLCAHGGTIVSGFPTVLIEQGGGGGGGPGGGGAAPGGGAQPGPGGNPAPASPVDDPAVQQGMREAWADSQAGDPANRHEEGGYIVRNADGSLGVERWPRGQGASIPPPARDAQGRYNGKEVLGEFHTHPNPPVDETGKRWTQGGHQGDWDGIAGENYPGDSYIISDGNVYGVDNQGQPNLDASGNEVPLGTRADVIGE